MQSRDPKVMVNVYAERPAGSTRLARAYEWPICIIKIIANSGGDYKNPINICGSLLVWRFKLYHKSTFRFIGRICLVDEMCFIVFFYQLIWHPKPLSLHNPIDKMSLRCIRPYRIDWSQLNTIVVGSSKLNQRARSSSIKVKCEQNTSERTSRMQRLIYYFLICD